MTDKLLPCPFCGGEAKFVEGVWSDNEICYVQCVDCRAGTNVCDTQDEAVTNWNKRPNPWHTGTPTEEGQYLVKLDVEHHVYPYYVLKWNKGGWYRHYDMDYPACPQHRVLKWQKIKETD